MCPYLHACMHEAILNQINLVFNARPWYDRGREKLLCASCQSQNAEKTRIFYPAASKLWVSSINDNNNMTTEMKVHSSNIFEIYSKYFKIKYVIRYDNNNKVITINQATWLIIIIIDYCVYLLLFHFRWHINHTIITSHTSLAADRRWVLSAFEFRARAMTNRQLK